MFCFGDSAFSFRQSCEPVFRGRRREMRGRGIKISLGGTSAYRRKIGAISNACPTGQIYGKANRETPNETTAKGKAREKADHETQEGDKDNPQDDKKEKRCSRERAERCSQQDGTKMKKTSRQKVGRSFLLGEVSAWWKPHRYSHRTHPSALPHDRWRRISHRWRGRQRVRTH